MGLKEEIEKYLEKVATYASTVFRNLITPPLRFFLAILEAPINPQSKYQELSALKWWQLINQIKEDVFMIFRRIVYLLEWGYENTEDNKNAFIQNVYLLFYRLFGLILAILGIVIFLSSYPTYVEICMFAFGAGIIPLIGSWLREQLMKLANAALNFVIRISLLIISVLGKIFDALAQGIAFIFQYWWYFIVYVVKLTKEVYVKIWYRATDSWWADSVAKIVLGKELYTALDTLYNALGGDALYLKMQAESKADWQAEVTADEVTASGFQAQPFSQIAAGMSNSRVGGSAGGGVS